MSDLQPLKFHMGVQRSVVPGAHRRYELALLNLIGARTLADITCVMVSVQGEPLGTRQWWYMYIRVHYPTIGYPTSSLTHFQVLWKVMHVCTL